MIDVQSLSHIRWECECPVVWIPKYRKKAIYKELRRYLGATFHDLARQKESDVIEGHISPDHVHILVLFRQSMRFPKR